MPKSARAAAINYILKLAWTKEEIAESLNRRRNLSNTSLNVPPAQQPRGIGGYSPVMGSPGSFGNVAGPPGMPAGSPAPPAPPAGVDATEWLRNNVPAKSNTGTQDVPAVSQGMNKGQKFVKFRNEMNAARASLAESAATSMRAGQQQTAQLIQSALQSLEQFDTKFNQVTQQGKNDRSPEMQSKVGNETYTALTDLRNNLVNVVAGIQQSAQQTDADQDNIPDNVDTDVGNDGIPDNADTFPGGFNAAQPGPSNVTEVFNNIVSQVNAGTMPNNTGKQKLWNQVVEMYNRATQSQQAPSA